MTFAGWHLFVGSLLLAMLLVNTALRGVPLTSPMVYLAIGWVLGPAFMDALRPDPIAHSAMLERIAEVGLLISLFAVGLRLRVPMFDRLWRLPLKLAFGSLTLLVLMVAAVGVVLLGLDPGVAIILGAILAPTDPVLASALQQEGTDPHPVRFALAAEGGLNDGAAYPFVMLGLALADHGGLHAGHWVLVEFLWSTLSGLGIGLALGTLLGTLVVFLRSRHGQALGLDVFLGLGLIGTSYGLADLCGGSGFLAVFAAGLALGRVREKPAPGSAALARPSTPAGHSYATLAGHSHHASETMRGSVEGFNEQIEKISEMGLVLLIGAMLPYAPITASIWWFIPLLLLVLRPLSVLPAYVGERADAKHIALASWFGIRGVGSLFYLLMALRAGVPGSAADILTSLTLWTIAVSIVVHGLSALPVMHWSMQRTSSHSVPFGVDRPTRRPP
ncbi:MAG TPA: cation:proton antiporter [Usitatibacter sp.]|nr:cation:proton antiporter [Usitatibacter sp.]